MKIRMDSGEYRNYQLIQQKQTKAPPQQKQNPSVSNQQNHQVQQSVLNRLQKDRVLGDALAVAQMSQHIINKAIVLSSQLRNIASEAIVEGRMDTDALQQVVSHIDSSFQEFGESIYIPVVVESGFQGENIPDPFEQLQQMREYSNIMNQSVDFEPIDRIKQNLLTKQKTVNDRVTVIAGEMRNLAPDTQKQTQQNDIADTAQQVVLNPLKSLEIQGNIQQEKIGQLL